VLRFRRPPRSFVVFLLLVVAIGAAVFFFFIASIEAKPAWKFWYGKQGSQYDGRGWRFNSWQRVDVTSPKELRRLPNIRD